jgi:hypothetical protein
MGIVLSLTSHASAGVNHHVMIPRIVAPPKITLFVMKRDVSICDNKSLVDRTYLA